MVRPRRDVGAENLIMEPVMNTQSRSLAASKANATAPEWVEAILSGFGTLFKRAMRQNRGRRTERALTRLSDAVLKDIGLNRTDIRHIRSLPIAGRRRGHRH